MYKIEKPEGAPEWFVPGIVCKVWNSPLVWERVIVWVNNGVFIDTSGMAWNNATPIESWEPMAGEWVAAWDKGSDKFSIVRYKEDGAPNGFYDTSCTPWCHIARITDGLDLRCTPDELKERTEWL